MFLEVLSIGLTAIWLKSYIFANAHSHGPARMDGAWSSMIPTIAGVGTIITAFFMGPLIDFFNVKCARPFLNRK